MGTHVKIHVSPLLDRAKIEAERAPKFFGSGSRTEVTGLRQPISRAAPPPAPPTPRGSKSSRDPPYRGVRTYTTGTFRVSTGRKIESVLSFDERAPLSCILHFHTLTVVFPPVHPYTLTLAIS